MTESMYKQKIQVFPINMGFIFISWYGNYHIALVAITIFEIFLLIQLDENKSCIFGKKLEYPLYII